MKAIILFLLICPFVGFSQTRQNPIVKTYGGIFDIPEATVKPDPNLDYNIVVDVFTGSDKPEEYNPSLISAARLMNLHGVGGVPKEKLHVVLVVHATSTYALMNNDAYRKKYKKDNPNLPLIAELQNAGAKIIVCGQSLLSRNVDGKLLAPGIEIGTSMLTTVTTYQLKGYAMLKF